MNQDIKIAFISIIVLRLSQLFLDYNYDRPDEYWQGPEIAHKMAYGYGFQTWEWTIPQPIRSPLYQIYLSWGYNISTTLQLPDCLKEKAAKMMQIIIACICDWFFLKIAHRYCKNISIFTYLCMLTNWYYFSMMNRTYINSVETCLTTAAFYYWSCRKQGKWNDSISRLIVGVCFTMRPTSLMVWAVIWPYELITTSQSKIKFILKNTLQIVLMVATGVGINSWWFGKLVWVEYNFFKVTLKQSQYNVLLKWSELYGVNPYLHYFYVSFPLIMGAYLLPFFLSVQTYLPNLKFLLKPSSLALLKQQNEDQWKQKQLQVAESHKFWQLLTVLLVILLVLSTSTHKQDRFILIITPLLLVLTLKGLHSLSSNKLLIGLIIAVNIFMFLSITLYGKTGGLEVLRKLRSEIDERKAEANITVMYLCQPHSLPMYSILLRNVTVDIIDSSPLRWLKQFDQTEQLHNNPQGLYDQMKSTKADPDFVIAQQKYAMDNGRFSEKYRFLLYKYEMVHIYRNINIWEERLIGWDGLILLKRKQNPP